MEFSADELNFLKTFFDFSDVDRDGVLSRMDIANVMGLDDKE